MNPPHFRPLKLLIAFLLISGSTASAQQPTSGESISLASARSDDRDVKVEVKTDGQLSFTASAGAKGTPGVSVLPESGSLWDFSTFSRIEAIVRNSGSGTLPVSLRVDNPGHWKTSPWSVETVRLAPGETKAIVVFFGYSNGFQESFSLDPAKTSQLLFFTLGAEKERSFVVESVLAAGIPDENPVIWKTSQKIAPSDGVLFGAEVPVASARQLSASAGATVEKQAGSAGFLFQFDGPGQVVRFKPNGMTWDLSQSNAIEIEIHNPNEASANLGFRMESKGGPTVMDTHTVGGGETARVIVPFSSPEIWNAATPDEADTGHRFASNAVGAIVMVSDPDAGEQTFEVSTIRAISPVAELPEWLGQRPPVSGDWEMTLEEEFGSGEIDADKWNVYTTNHWDKRSHFSAENVILESGAAKLRFEKKTGHHNDDPEEKTTSYATGFLDTFGKWSQRYGYFEARMKLPKAPGLWPAFWMMPDRGPSDAPRWKREQTTKGGMEFDIMEYLSGWGPYRFNVAFHWDGYGKGHKSAGTSGIYAKTDAEGFVTTGLLWLPGKAVYYCNGEPVGAWESPRISNVPSILMFTHVSGGWDNLPLDDTALPDEFVIDYVRCWQRKDLE